MRPAHASPSPRPDEASKGEQAEWRTLYSPMCVEGECCELRVERFQKFAKKVPNLVNLGDAPTSIEDYAANIT